MSRPFTKYLSLAVLVIFMTNMGVWSFHSNWLAHELEHSGTLEVMAATADHADAGKLGALADNNEKSPATMDHQLLHAVDHLQFFPGAVIDGIFASQPGAVRYHCTSFNVALATFETPFRPPSHSPSLS